MDITKLLKMGACIREESSSFCHPVLLLSEEKIAKTYLQEKLFSLVGNSLPSSRFTQAV